MVAAEAGAPLIFRVGAAVCAAGAAGAAGAAALPAGVSLIVGVEDAGGAGGTAEDVVFSLIVGEDEPNAGGAAMPPIFGFTFSFIVSVLLPSRRVAPSGIAAFSRITFEPGKAADLNPASGEPALRSSCSVMIHSFFKKSIQNIIIQKQYNTGNGIRQMFFLKKLLFSHFFCKKRRPSRLFGRNGRKKGKERIRSPVLSFSRIPH